MITAEGLTIEYSGNTRAVDEVSFSIGAGENVSLAGANGAGKTSLLLALVGVLPPKAGNIFADVKIGLVFQNPDDQLFMANIYEDVAFGPRNLGCDEKETEKRVDCALSMLGIKHLASRSPLKLSGGEKRLAAIATVLAMEPDFLLLDEPAAFLDPRARRYLISILSELPQGKLIATHDLALAEAVCSRALLMQNGKLVADKGIGLLSDTAALEAAGL